MAVNKQYVSDATLFLHQMLKDKPELIEKQKELRKTWWDRNDVDVEEIKKSKESSIATTSGYQYYE